MNMKKINKILSFILVFMCSFTFIACNQKQEQGKEEEKAEVQNEDKVEISDRVFYVTPNGESMDGTKENPTNLINALIMVQPGNTILLAEGKYSFGSRINIATDGLYNARITIKPEVEGSKVVFDFSRQSFASTNRGIQLYANYYTIYGIDICGAGDNGLYVSGNYNVIENCQFYNNRDSGLQLGRGYSEQTTIDEWPSNNLIKNCTSFNNYDDETLGENADGFAAKLTVGYGNVFDGCIAYRNSDDGWDLYTKGDSGPIGPVTLINCIAFNNGVTSGRNTNGKPYGTPNSDGNGFKLGGEVIAVAHKVYNCIAFNNLACGFTDNSNPGPLYLENCTSYNNGLRDADSNNFDMCRDADTSINYIKNCLSYSDSNVKFTDGEIKHFNSKDQYKGTVVDSIFYHGRTMLQFKGIKAADYTVSSMMGEIIKATNAPFIDTTIIDELSDFHTLWRDENGDIKLNDFLKVNDAFVKETFGEDSTVKLGADLA